MATIQIRIDEKTKRSVQKVLAELGLDMSTAVKAYLKQIELHEGIPLKLVTKNGLTPQEEKEIIKASRQARRGENVSKSFKSAKALIDNLKS